MSRKGNKIDEMRWSLYEHVQLSQADFRAKLKSLDQTLMVDKAKQSFTKRRTWCQEGKPGMWYLFTTKGAKDDLKYAQLRVREPDGSDGEYCFKVYQTNLRDDSHNFGGDLSVGTGKIAYETVTDILKQVYAPICRSLKMPFLDFAFGKTPEEFKKFIPRQFYFFNPRYKDKYVEHASYADFCSMFPSCMLGEMPYANGMREVEGEVEPSKLYPFAFYPDTCDLAEYNGFDTRKWPVNDFKDLAFALCNQWRSKAYMQGKTITKTILMPAAFVHFDECWQALYKRRNDPTAPAQEKKAIKLVMNAFIGSLHMEKYQHQQAHVVAVVLARAGQKMLNVGRTIDINHIVQIAIDGIIYDSPVAVGTKQKALTVLHQNYADQRLFEHSMNCYCWIDRDTGKVVEAKHQGYNCDASGSPLSDDWMPQKPEELLELVNDTSLQETIKKVLAKEKTQRDALGLEALERIEKGECSLSDFWPKEQRMIKEVKHEMDK